MDYYSIQLHHEAKIQKAHIFLKSLLSQYNKGIFFKSRETKEKIATLKSYVAYAENGLHRAELLLDRQYHALKSLGYNTNLNQVDENHNALCNVIGKGTPAEIGEYLQKGGDILKIAPTYDIRYAKDTPFYIGVEREDSQVLSAMCQHISAADLAAGLMDGRHVYQPLLYTFLFRFNESDLEIITNALEKNATSDAELSTLKSSFLRYRYDENKGALDKIVEYGSAKGAKLLLKNVPADTAFFYIADEANKFSPFYQALEQGKTDIAAVFYTAVGPQNQADLLNQVKNHFGPTLPTKITPHHIIDGVMQVQNQKI